MENEKAAAQHTPTPWGYSTDLTPSLEDPNPTGAVIFSDGFAGNIAALDDNEDGCMEANAAFIVKACNAHDDLVDALRQLTAYVQGYGYGERWAGRPHAQMDRAVEALKKAGV